MLSARVNPVLDRFSHYIRTGRVAFFVGAGISHPHPSHLPLAGQVAEAIVRNMYRSSSFMKKVAHSKSRRFMSENDLIRMLLCSPGHVLRFECLMQLVLDTVSDSPLLSVFHCRLPNYYHRFMAEVLSLGNQVVTVNFDTLIETAFSGDGRLRVSTVDRLPRDRSRKSAKSRILFKLHGTIEREESVHIAIRQVGRAGLAFMWEPRKAQFLERLVQSHRIIVMGYSGADDLDIMSKLSITDFPNEVLWIKHADCSPSIIKKGAYHRVFDDDTLLRFLQNHNVTVLRGGTSTVTAALWRRSLSTACLVPLQPVACNCRHKNSYLSRIQRTVHQWSLKNPGMVDFLAARLLQTAGFPVESLAVFRRLERLFDRVRDYANWSRTLVNMGTIEEDLGLYTEAIRRHESACPVLAEQGDLSTWCNSSTNLAVLYMRQGRHGEATHRLTGVIDTARQLGFKSECARARTNLAAVLRRSGNYDLAEKQLRKAYKAYKSLGDHAGCAATFLSAGEVAFSQGGNVELAEALFRMAMEEAKTIRDSAIIAKSWLDLGVLYARSGNTAAAVKAYHSARSIADALCHKQYVTLCDIGLCKVALSRGRLGKALALARTLITEAKRVGLHEQAAELRGNIGLALLNKGSNRDALRYFHAAKRDFQSTVKAPELLAFTFLNIGCCHLNLGNRTTSAKYLHEALALYEGLRMKAQADHVRVLFSQMV